MDANEETKNYVHSSGTLVLALEEGILTSMSGVQRGVMILSYSYLKQSVERKENWDHTIINYLKLLTLENEVTQVL